MTDDLAPDLTRTVALMGDGYRITQLARAKRAQERHEMLTAPDPTRTIRAQLADLANANHLGLILNAAIALDKAIRAAGGEPAISCHRSTEMARAALRIDGALRTDVTNRADDLPPFTSVRLGPIVFIADEVLP